MSMPMDMQKDIMPWITAVGAVIAAVTGAWNLWRQHRQTKDRLLVWYGDPDAIYLPVEGVTFQNKSEHVIAVLDYGLVDDGGGLYSIPDHDQACQGWDENCRISGNPRSMAKGAIVIASISALTKTKIIGAYAQATGHGAPTFSFKSSVGVFQRIKIRWRYSWLPGFF